jgi:hypothetical protein
MRATPLDAPGHRATGGVDTTLRAELGLIDETGRTSGGGAAVKLRDRPGE